MIEVRNIQFLLSNGQTADISLKLPDESRKPEQDEIDEAARKFALFHAAAAGASILEVCTENVEIKRT